jgi:hypothetical protein
MPQRTDRRAKELFKLNNLNNPGKLKKKGVERGVHSFKKERSPGKLVDSIDLVVLGVFIILHSICYQQENCKTTVCTVLV